MYTQSEIIEINTLANELLYWLHQAKQQPLAMHKAEQVLQQFMCLLGYQDL